MGTLQDHSRTAGRSIDENADPNCRNCAGSGWYMRHTEIETCDCTVKPKLTWMQEHQSRGRALREVPQTDPEIREWKL